MAKKKISGIKLKKMFRFKLKNMKFIECAKWIEMPTVKRSLFLFNYFLNFGKRLLVSTRNPAFHMLSGHCLYFTAQFSLLCASSYSICLFSMEWRSLAAGRLFHTRKKNYYERWSLIITRFAYWEIYLNIARTISARNDPGSCSRRFSPTSQSVFITHAVPL